MKAGIVKANSYHTHNIEDLMCTELREVAQLSTHMRVAMPASGQWPVPLQQTPISVHSYQQPVNFSEV